MCSLDNGNECTSVPTGHSVQMKENYMEIKTALKLIKYDYHKWIKCTDFKLVNSLLGQQSGYFKCPCLLCLWKSRARDQHWVKEQWLAREKLEVGKQNVINTPLVVRKKILFPPLHSNMAQCSR